MAEKKSATVIDAARSLVALPDLTIDPEDRCVLRQILSSAYRSSADLAVLRRTLEFYSTDLALQGFVFADLSSPAPGPSDGVFQMEIPGQYKVDTLPDLAVGTVDVGNGRKFMTVAWGGLCPGTIILRQSETPKCWVEVAQFIDRKEPEAAVTCLLLGRGDPGTPFDELKRKLSTWERRTLRQGQLAAKVAVGSQKKGRRGNAGGNT